MEPGENALVGEDRYGLVENVVVRSDEHFGHFVEDLE